MNLRWLCWALLFNWMAMIFVAFAEPSGLAFVTIVFIGLSSGLLAMGMRKLDPDNKYFDY